MAPASQPISDSDLPVELTPDEAVIAAYPDELLRCHEALRRGVAVLVECDKDLAPVFATVLRDRLEKEGRRCSTLDGRGAATPGQGLAAAILAELRAVVRQPGGERAVILPHLDLFAASSDEARELVPLLYENAAVVALGFKDPASPLPRAIDDHFARRERILGVARDRLPSLVTRDEAQRLGGLDPYRLHRHISGVNAVRLRRILATTTGVADLRAATLFGDLSVPSVDLDADIGGYARVKARLRGEILEVLARRDAAGDADEIRRIEALVPRGLVLWGPPGTGKTLFARALASSLGAAFTVVSGPELKSKWVAGSEEQLRQVFVRARQAAPAVIVLDELDAFAGRRGMYAGSTGVEHSMFNQLLAEMDAIGRDELVLVVGTCNVPEVLDPALLRPGRFELEIEVGPPDVADRRAILSIYDARFELALSPAAMDYAVERTGDVAFANGATMTGDHLQALARGVARERLRAGAEQAPTEAAAVEQALAQLLGRKPSQPERDRVVAVHEAGHALAALVLGQSVERLAVGGDLGSAVGVAALSAVRRGDATRTFLLDSVCILLAGREAEDELLGDVTAGAAHDLQTAAALARAIAGDLGMGPALFADLEMSRGAIDLAARDCLRLEQERARKILEEQRDALAALSTELLRRQVLDRPALEALVKFGEAETAAEETPEAES